MLVILTNIPTPYRTAFFNELATRCHSDGIEFKVLYCAHSEKGRHWNWDENQQKYEYTFLKGYHPIYKHYTANFNISVLNELRKLQPKWLIISGAWNIPTMMLAQLFGHAKYKIFWSEGHENAEIIRSKPISWFRKYFFNGYQYFAVPNELSKNYILKINTDVKDFFYIPNTIDTYYYGSHDKTKLQLREEWNVSPEAIIFLQISALSHRKGVLELCKAFINLPPTQNIHLMIAGEGPLYRDIDNLLSNCPNKQRIILTGHVSQYQIRELLHLCDFFILNSNADPNPISSIEAATAGLPLILSNKTGNYKELITEGSNGWIIDKNNASSLRDILTKALQLDNIEIKKMGAKSKEKVFEKFSAQNVAKELIHTLLLKLK